MMAVEGVLGNSDEFSASMLANDVAVRLYGSLSAYHRVVLVTSAEDTRAVDWWLRTQGVLDYVQILPRPLDAGPEVADVREAQLRALRASRTAVVLVVDSDAATVAHAMSVGVTGLLYGPPRPAAGRMDLGARRIRDWSAIVGEIETQDEIRRGADA